MRVFKGISLFFLYPLTMLVIGFWGGVRAVRFFYPGEMSMEQPGVMTRNQSDQYEEKYFTDGADPEDPIPEIVVPEETREVSAREEKLSTDTEYVLEETDVLRQTVEETVWKLPDKYVGMNREQFVSALKLYEKFPPLSEMEKGFVSLEVLSFSRERVVVQMNYRYVQPGSGYYLAVQGNEVVVYLEDRETVYFNTGIKMDDLPEDLQLEIIDMLYMEDEGKLYNFLETYSS